VVPGDHMVLIDQAGDAWTAVRDWLGDRRTSAVKRITLESVTELARSRRGAAPPGAGRTSASEEER